MVTIHITRSDGTSYPLSFSTQTLVIGRSKDADIQLDGPQISLKHARVRWVSEARIVLTDLRSATGTHVRGKRLRSTAVLAPNEPAHIAGYTLRFSAPHLPHNLPFEEHAVTHLPEGDLERLERSVQEGDQEQAANLYRMALRQDNRDAALLALCHATPGDVAWNALCECIDFSSPDEREGLLERFEKALQGWPDYVRRATTRWWRAVLQDHQAPVFRLVRSLDLSGEALPAEALSALCNAPALRHIRLLNLAEARFKAPGELSCVLSSPHLSSLSTLSLRGLRMTAGSVGALREAPCLRGLRVLDLSGCGMTDELLRLFLGAGEVLSSLERLSLADNDLGSGGARALSRARHLRQLTRLDVRGNAWQPQDLFQLKTRSVYDPGVVFALIPQGL